MGEEESRRPGRQQQQQQAQQQAQQNLNSELALSKEQLYDLFQQILGVKKFEHQLLFNALQVIWGPHTQKENNERMEMD